MYRLYLLLLLSL